MQVYKTTIFATITSPGPKKTLKFIKYRLARTKNYIFRFHQRCVCIYLLLLTCGVTSDIAWPRSGSSNNLHIVQSVAKTKQHRFCFHFAECCNHSYLPIHLCTVCDAHLFMYVTWSRLFVYMRYSTVLVVWRTLRLWLTLT